MNRLRKAVAAGAFVAGSLGAIGGGAALMGEGFKEIFREPSEQQAEGRANYDEGMHKAMGGGVLMLAGVLVVTETVPPRRRAE